MSDFVEIVSSGSLDKAADLLHRLAGPVFDELGAILADKVRVYRATNLVSTLQKTQRILHEAGLPTNAVPTRLLLPIIESSSIEDDETLQEMWAGLLATASQATDSVSPSYAETLKQMTPDEARYINRIYGERTDPNSRYLDLKEQLLFGGKPKNIDVETYERLGIVRREYGLTREGGETEVGSLRRFSTYGVAFLAACRGPLKHPNNSASGTT